MKSTGPFLNKDYGGFDRPRGLFSNLPVGVDLFCDYNMFFDDFLSFNATAGTLTGTLSTTGTIVDVAAAACAGTTTPSAANVDTAIDTLETSTNLALKELASRLNKWLVVKDTGASVLASADAENGVLVITSDATTDANGGSIQTDNTQFLVKTGKKLWFEARIKVSDADQGPMFVGLADNFATNPEGVVVNGISRVGFELLDGAATINTVQDNDTTATRVITSISAADDTYIRLGFRTDGGHIRYYINRALVGSVAIASANAAITLGPAFMHLSGNATGTHTASIDYIMCAQER